MIIGCMQAKIQKHPSSDAGNREVLAMFKKTIFLSVVIFSVLMLSGCGAINVQLPAADGEDAGISITAPDADAPADAAPADGAPAQGAFDNNVLLFVIIGLIGAIVLIALLAVISGRRGSGNNM